LRNGDLVPVGLAKFGLAGKGLWAWLHSLRTSSAT
jgi:hypothetical protein